MESEMKDDREEEKTRLLQSVNNEEGDGEVRKKIES